MLCQHLQCYSEHCGHRSASKYLLSKVMNWILLFSFYRDTFWLLWALPSWISVQVLTTLLWCSWSFICFIQATDLLIFIAQTTDTAFWTTLTSFNLLVYNEIYYHHLQKLDLIFYSWETFGMVYSLSWMQPRIQVQPQKPINPFSYHTAVECHHIWKL